MKITILGCGPAGGVPSLSRGWGDCDPAEPRNYRLRPSILVQEGGTTVLVDTSPDCRHQLLSARVSALDAVLYTHAHADHLHGIDDLREVNRAMKRALPIYGTQEVLDDIRVRFPYVLGEIADVAKSSIYRPMLLPKVIDGRFQVGDISILPMEQSHGHIQSLGFRFGRIAYSTDVSDMPEETFAQLADIDIWVVGCLTHNPHPTHAHLDKVLGWIKRVNPRQAILTHMTACLDYGRLRQDLPSGVVPAHDGMIIEE